MNNDLQNNDQDPELRAAYERLGSALEAPVDVLERVERRIRVRRRRRVAGVGGATLVALATVGTVGAFALSGNDPTSSHVADEPTPPAGPVSTLALARTDGSTYTFEDITVSCRTDADSGQQRILAESPRRTEGDRLVEPVFYFEGILDKLAAGRTFSLPVDGPGGSESYPLTLFFATDEGGPRANELSSSEMGSSGTVEVVSASCGATPGLELVVDATLGSEVQQPPMRISGELQ